ncbi:MAG: hypothetical protein KGJ13_02405 [Patescibacteria group bacterium]|nr:hypothetical protein [Patescibacteria group bacterium]
MGDVLVKEAIPQEFRDSAVAGYLKDLADKPWNAESQAAVFKKLHNAEALVGKKTVGLPEGDKDEEWTPFLEKLRASKPDGYEVKVQQGQKVDEEFAKDLREAFYNSGIHPRQASKFQDVMLASLARRQAKQLEAAKKLDAEFETISKTALGESNKETMARVKKALDEFAPASLKQFLPKLDNNSLVIMAGVIDAIQRKYMSEDDLKPSGTVTTNTDPSAREKAKTLMASEAFTNEFHPKHDETVAEVQRLYQEAEHGKK